MRIARFDAGQGAQLGIVKGDGVLALSSGGFSYSTLPEIMEAGRDGLTAIADRLRDAPASYTLADVRLLAPILRPGKYLGIGMNYRKHAAEVVRIGVATPKQQLWFNKQTTCIAGPYDDIDPGVSLQLDYEVELGVMIGKAAKSVCKAQAREHVFGYFVANDVSARDWQFHSQTFMMGKSFDTHGPIGPWVVTADEIEDPHALDLRCIVNGEVCQASNTREMIHDIDDQIAYLSTAFTLQPGDLLATGTPEGVGAAMLPPQFLQSGDLVRCEIAGIGAIENRVRTRA